MAPRSGAISSRYDSGFTLVELVVVIAIFAVVAVVAVPRFASASARAKLDSASSRVVQDISVTAATAQASSSDRQVAFDATQDEYVLVGVASRGRGSSRSIKIGAAPYHTNIVSASFEGGPLLVLNGHGVVEGSGSIQLALGRLGKRILVTAGSSAVTVQSFELTTRADNDVMPSVKRVIGQVTLETAAADPMLVRQN